MLTAPLYRSTLGGSATHPDGRPSRPARPAPEGEARLSSLLEAVAAWIVDVASAWGYVGVALEMALESANVPLPSEVVLPFAGYLVAIGRLEFWGAVLAGLVGGLAGSLASYAAGYYGGRPFVLSTGRVLHLREDHLHRAERWFARYGDWAVCLARLVPVVRTFISLPAGFGRMPVGRFLAFSALGSLPWTVALVWAGRVLGDHWDALEPIFRRFDWLILLAAAGLALLVLARWIRRHVV